MIPAERMICPGWQESRMSRIAVIPARGGSKGIPKKNLALLQGQPMIFYTIHAARQSGLFDGILVSSDDPEILDYAMGCGVLGVQRPAELARDDSPTEPTVLHAMDWWAEAQRSEPEVVCLLQPTSPLRTSRDILDAEKLFTQCGADSLLSVTEKREFHWRVDGGRAIPAWDISHRPRRQKLEPIYVENGAIYITRSPIYREQKNRLGGKMVLYPMPPERSVDIDEPFDLRLAEGLLHSQGIQS